MQNNFVVAKLSEKVFAKIRKLPISQRLLLILWLAHESLVAFLLWQHELWRDELQVWSIADSSRNPLTVITNTRLEGRPPLWHLIIWPLTVITDNPNWMGLLTFFIGLFATWIWIRHVQLPIFLRIAILFGFHLTGGYLTHSREYVLLFLILTISLVSSRKFGLRWRTTASICALSMVNLFGLLIAAALLISIAITPLRDAVRSPRSRATKNTVLQLITAGIVFLFCAYWIYPTDKNQFQGFRYNSFSTALTESITPFKLEWIFFDRINDILAISILIAIVVGLFLTSRVAGIFVAMASTLLLANSTFGFASYWWHWGNLLIALVCAPLLTDQKASRHSFLAKTLTTSGLTALAVGSLLANQWGPGKQIYTNTPYSMSGATVIEIKRLCSTDCTVIVDWDATGAAISARLNGHALYYLNRSEFGTFARYVNTNSMPTWQSAVAAMKTFTKPLLVSTDLLVGQPPPELKLEAIATPWGGVWDNAIIWQLSSQPIAPKD